MGLMRHVEYEAWCDDCEAEPLLAAAGREVAVEALRRLGWAVSGSIVRCPDCRRRP